MSLWEERLDDLRHFADLDERFLLPGTVVTGDGACRSVGIIVYMFEKEGHQRALVLWSMSPTLEDRRVNQTAREVRDEINADIMRDLMAMDGYK